MILLILTYFVALALRLTAVLILGRVPFYDPYAYIGAINLYTTGNPAERATVLNRSHSGFYSLLLVVFNLTEIPIEPFSMYFPPILASITVFPIYLLTKELFRSKLAGLLSSILFSVTEIVVLRQSYLIPEGIAIGFLLFVLFYTMKAINSQNFLKHAGVAVFLYYCLCTFHNLTATMTLIPLLVTLIAYLIFSPVGVKATRIIDSSQAMRFVIIIVAIALTWIYWAKERQYAGFIGSFLSINIEAILVTFRGEQEPTPEGFTEHYYATEESSSIIDLVAMNGGSLLVTLIAFIYFLRLIRRPKKDLNQFFLLSWIVSMFVNFALNILIDALFDPGTYGQQAYRAWIFFIIPTIILASKELTSIQNNAVFRSVMISTLLICAFGSVWFIGFLMESFPH